MSTRTERIIRAIDKADYAFWMQITKEFPEITSGDVSPERAQRRVDHNFEDVTNWVEENLRKPYVASVTVHFNDGSVFEIDQCDSDSSNHGTTFSAGASDIPGARDLEQGIYGLLTAFDLMPDEG